MHVSLTFFIFVVTECLNVLSFETQRTAVLFTRKAQANQRKPDTPVKEESLGQGGEPDVSLSPVDKLKSPKKPGRNKRNSSRKSIESVDAAPSSAIPQTSIVPSGSSAAATLLDKKRSPPVGKALSASASAVRGSGAAGGFEVIPDSFRVYRAQDMRGLSDSEDSHMSYSGSSCSSCSGFDDSGTGSDFG